LSRASALVAGLGCLVVSFGSLVPVLRGSVAVRAGLVDLEGIVVIPFESVILSEARQDDVDGALGSLTGRRR
jgi:hypothetical protein